MPAPAPRAHSGLSPLDARGDAASLAIARAMRKVAR
jgi:hypothetical protein